MGPFRKVGEFLHRYFIPSEANGYRPHALQKAASVGILFLVLLTFTLVNIQSIALLTSQWLSSAILPSVLIDLTNENRADEALGTLRHSALLDEAARLKAEDMAKGEYFAHDSPTGVTPWYWFERVGYEYTYAGENLAVHFTDSDDVVKAWMKSPGHRANIMSANYTEIGIGTAKGEYKGSPTIFVVQLFGRPLSSSQKIAIANAEAAPETKPTTSTVDGPGTDEVPQPAPSVPEVVSPLQEESSSTTTDTSESVLSGSVIDLETLEVSTTTEGALVSEEAAPTTRDPLISTGTPPHTVSVLSDVATISPYIARGVIEVPIGENGGNTAQVRESHILSQLAVRPHLVLSIIYTLLALAIVGALGVSIALEWRRAHLVQVAYGVGLMATMWVALYVHTALTSGALIM